MLTIRRHRGSSLIEVLIAMLILSVGMLGFAALQTQAMRTNYEAMQRARASSLAEDLFDRMRANTVVAVTSSRYLRAAFDDTAPTLTGKKLCNVETCTANEMADWQFADWYVNRLKVQNAAASVQILKPEALNPRLVQINIQLVEVTAAQQNDFATVSDAKLITDQLVTFSYVTML